jgi:methylenetetrahydromethanopterin dehydrogenase
VVILRLVVNIGFIKIGNIASAPLVEFLLDERAEREDISVRSVGTGAKMGGKEVEEASKEMLQTDQDLILLTSPNASLPGPRKIAKMVSEAGKPFIVISDAPAKKAIEEFDKLGVGYIIIEADSMIGARREFLDPTEMALFNADLIKILAITGAFNVVRNELNSVIFDLKSGKSPTLPRLTLDADKAVEAADFQNPYARCKAIAAYEIAKSIAKLTVKGCFMVKEAERYIPLVSTAHEMVRTASQLADEAREIEKFSDTVSRTPHFDDGTILSKRSLMEKPKEKSS